MRNPYLSSKLKRAILRSYERGEVQSEEARYLIVLWGLQSA